MTDPGAAHLVTGDRGAGGALAGEGIMPGGGGAGGGIMGGAGAGSGAAFSPAAALAGLDDAWPWGPMEPGALSLEGLDTLLADGFGFTNEQDAAAGMAALFPHGGQTVLLSDLHWAARAQQAATAAAVVAPPADGGFALQPEYGDSAGAPSIPRQGSGSSSGRVSASDSVQLDASGDVPSYTAGSGSAGQGAAKRGRGRPPKASGIYSKAYKYVKEYRERQKDRVEALAREVGDKLEQVQLLTAENEMLQAREEVLMAALSTSHSMLQGSTQPVPSCEQQGGARTVSEAAAAVAAAVAAKAGPGNGRQAAAQQRQRAAAGGAAAAAAAAAAAPPSLLQPGPIPPGPLPPLLVEFLKMYQLYMDHLARRVLPDGTVRRLHPGESRFPPNRELMRLSMAQTPEQTNRVLMTNLETGEVVSTLPPGHWTYVAGALDLTPEQRARIAAAMRTFGQAMRRLMAQREMLKAELAEAMRRLEGTKEMDAGGPMGRAGALSAVEGAMIDLRLNLVREHRVRLTTAWALKLMIKDEQLGMASLLSWPFLPRFPQIAACLLGLENFLGAAATN